MAGGGFVDENDPKKKNYPGKLTWKVVLTSVIAAAGGLIFGYDLGISGGVTSMDPFLKKFFPKVYLKESNTTASDDQYCKFNSETLTLFTSSLYIAALISSVGFSGITRKLGRRVTMFAAGILFAIGALLNGLAQNLGMLYAGRFFLGFGIGCANLSVPIYLSEVAPYKYRGGLNMLFQLSITIGIFIANILNYFFAKMKNGQGWRLSLGLAIVPALIIIFGTLILPETPNSLIERGYEEKAKEELKKLRGVDNVDAEFEDLVLASTQSKKVERAWKNIGKREYRPQVVMAFCIPMFQQLTGMNVIVFYAPVLFKTIGFGGEASLMSAVITGGFNFAATLISIGTVDKMGRRFFFIWGGVQMLIFQVIEAIAIGAKYGTDGKPGTLPMWYAVMVVAVICFYVSGFAMSWGPLGWLVPSEIFPLEIRSAAQSINVAVNMIFTFLIAQIFTAMLCALKFGLFIVFATCVVIMVSFIYIYMPETKGIPIEEMQEVWRNHPRWKKYYQD